jgi:hypothetical protein
MWPICATGKTKLPSPRAPQRGRMNRTGLIEGDLREAIIVEWVACGVR